jgi:hypothetical protein
MSFVWPKSQRMRIFGQHTAGGQGGGLVDKRLRRNIALSRRFVGLTRGAGEEDR